MRTCSNITIWHTSCAPAGRTRACSLASNMLTTVYVALLTCCEGTTHYAGKWRSDTRAGTHTINPRSNNIVIYLEVLDGSGSLVGDIPTLSLMGSLTK